MCCNKKVYDFVSIILILFLKNKQIKLIKKRQILKKEFIQILLR